MDQIPSLNIGPTAPNNKQRNHIRVSISDVGSWNKQPGLELDLEGKKSFDLEVGKKNTVLSIFTT